VPGSSLLSLAFDVSVGSGSMAIGHVKCGERTLGFKFSFLLDLKESF
jgi:hypothetical protein